MLTEQINKTNMTDPREQEKIKEIDFNMNMIRTVFFT